MKAEKIKRERQEMLAFYHRPDVSTVFGEYEQHLAQLYDKIVGAEYPYQRETKRMTLDGFIKGAVTTTDLYPEVLKRSDFELLFDKIIEERVDKGSDMDPKKLTEYNQSISFEEFKKSIIRISTLVEVTATKKRMDPHEIYDAQQRLLDNAGAQAPSEWDEEGYPIRYMTVIGLKRKEGISYDSKKKSVKGKKSFGIGARGKGASGSALQKSGVGGAGGDDSKNPEEEEEESGPYEVKKLGLQKFHHVLHYMYQHSKNKEPAWIQPPIDGENDQLDANGNLLIAGQNLDGSSSNNLGAQNSNRKNGQNKQINITSQNQHLFMNENGQGRGGQGSGLGNNLSYDDGAGGNYGDQFMLPQLDYAEEQKRREKEQMEMTLGGEITQLIDENPGAQKVYEFL